MLQILIVCTGNTCRSPMAEVLLKDKIKKHYLTDQIVVSSAGVAVWGEGGASMGAKMAMGRRGINMLNHRSHRLLPEDIQSADLLLTMTANHKAAVIGIMPEAIGKVYSLAEFAGEDRDIMDPYGASVAVYETCAEQIEEMLEKSWKKIVSLAGEKDCIEKNEE